MLCSGTSTRCIDHEKGHVLEVKLGGAPEKCDMFIVELQVVTEKVKVSGNDKREKSTERGMS